MKWQAYIITVLLIFSHHSYSKDRGIHDTTGIAKTICMTTVYAVSIEYPNFFVSLLAHIAGVHTDSLKFVEWDMKTPILCSFLLHLTDNDEHRWFEIASDSAFPSFVKLPLENRTALEPSALKFISKALQFFRDPGTDTLHAAFDYGQDILGANVFHLSNSADTGSTVRTTSHIETWNKRTGEEYIHAEVTALTQDGNTTFPNIKVFLKKKKIILQLASVRTAVVSSKY